MRELKETDMKVVSQNEIENDTAKQNKTQRRIAPKREPMITIEFYL